MVGKGKSMWPDGTKNGRNNVSAGQREWYNRNGSREKVYMEIIVRQKNWKREICKYLNICKNMIISNKGVKNVSSSKC